MAGRVQGAGLAVIANIAEVADMDCGLGGGKSGGSARRGCGASEYGCPMAVGASGYLLCGGYLPEGLRRELYCSGSRISSRAALNTGLSGLVERT